MFGFFLATLLVPAELTVVVNQRTIDSLGWINSYQGLIVPLLATTFGTFLVRQVFLTVPKDLREAAALDGVGHFRFLWEVAVPLCRPTLGALALFTFLGTWNQYLWPQAIITDDAHRTIQIGLERLKTGDLDTLNLVTAGTRDRHLADLHRPDRLPAAVGSRAHGRSGQGMKRLGLLTSAALVAASCGSGQSIITAGRQPPTAATQPPQITLAPDETLPVGETRPEVQTTIAPTTTAAVLDTLPNCPTDALDSAPGPVDITFWHRSERPAS